MKFKLAQNSRHVFARTVAILLLPGYGCVEPVEPLSRPLFSDGLPAPVPEPPQLHFEQVSEPPVAGSTAFELVRAVHAVERVIAEIYADRGVVPESVAALDLILAAVEPSACEAALHSELLAIAKELRAALDGGGVRYVVLDVQVAALRAALHMEPRPQDLEPLQLACIIMQSVIVEPDCHCSRRRLRTACRLTKESCCPRAERRRTQALMKLVREYCQQPTPARRSDALHATLALNRMLQLDGERQCWLINKYGDRLPL